MIFDVAFLDVGQGDCAVVTVETAGDPRRRCLVIDGGDECDRGVRHQPGAPSAAARLAAYLRARGIRYVDLLVGTHLDSEHIGGLVTFLADHTATREGDRRFWNSHPICIGQYWGPPHDPASSVGDSGSGAGPDRYAQALKLLAKSKLKRKPELSSGEQSDLRQTEAEIRQLLDRYAARPHLQQAASQNARLHALLREHVDDPDRNIQCPDLRQPPRSPIPHLRIDLLWPDEQKPDLAIQAEQARPLQVQSGRTTMMHSCGPRLDALGLFERVLSSQDGLAMREARKANNRSIVLRVGPVEWAGVAEGWPRVLFAADAESESWRRILARHGAAGVSAAILKAPQHGGASMSGLPDEALAAIAPRYAIISVEQILRVPSIEVLTRLRGAGAELFCTQRNADPDLFGPSCLPAGGRARSDPSDSCGIAFSFDTSRATCSVAQLRWETIDGRGRMRASLVPDFERDRRWRSCGRRTSHRPKK